jgi:hypothetical protein
VSDAGAPQSAKVGATITLNGSASSDADGDRLSFAWTLVTKPAGSQASLSNANIVAPSFVPDVAGSYVFSLVVNDGKADSQPSTVTITIAPQT